jgi:phenylalanyl-tRNA synthetase alpha chain
MATLEEIKAQFDRDLGGLEAALDGKTAPGDEKAPLPRRFEDLKVRYLGKKGEISALLRSMGALPAEERPAFGKRVNELRDYADERLSAVQQRVDEAAIEGSLKASGLDATLPGYRVPLGTLHPLTQVRDEIISFFQGLGFELAMAPEVDNDWYNFEALNIPPDHPSRDMHDTFYVDDRVVLRTHTSNTQVHYMERHREPPIRIIAPGFVYRVDNDATHSPMFQQVECLLVDQGVSFAHLKGTLYLWVKHMFGSDARLRFRPSYFPFTEPSAEMDMTCYFCKGKGCRTCKNTGWIEIGGCGSVDPNVFEKVGWDPEKYTGFAFGFGIDRIAMLRYGIPDIGHLTRNDNRFLRQF